MSRALRSRTFAVVVVAVVTSISITALLAAVAPTAKITSPANKAKVSGIIGITAQVKGTPDLKYVVLVLDDTRPGSSNSPSCTFEVDTRELTDGAHKVSLEAFDSSGLLVTSKTITIYVKNGVPPPAAEKTPVEAKAPAAPARSVASAPEPTAAQAAARAEAEPAPATPAPVVAAAGPMPEPIRTAALPNLTPQHAARAAAVSAGGFPAPPSSAVPPVIAVVPGTSRLVLNGQPARDEFMPTVIQGRMHGGFRVLFTGTGAHVSWLADVRTARSKSESQLVEVPVGSRVARVNGKDVDMGSSALLRDGRTVIPVRFFADVTGATLTWHQKTGVAEVRTAPRSVAQQP